MFIGSIGADNVVLHWIYDNRTNTEPPLYYRVTYLPIGGVASTVEVGHKEGQLEYSFTLIGLKPSTTYEISVASMTAYLTSESLNLLIQTLDGDIGIPGIMTFSLILHYSSENCKMFCNSLCKSLIYLDLAGYDWLYSLVHDGCVATTGAIYYP